MSVGIEIVNFRNAIWVALTNVTADNENSGRIDCLRNTGKVARSATFNIHRSVGSTNAVSVTIQASNQADDLAYHTMVNGTAGNVRGLVYKTVDYTSASGAPELFGRYIRVIVLTVGSGNTLNIYATIHTG